VNDDTRNTQHVRSYRSIVSQLVTTGDVLLHIVSGVANVPTLCKLYYSDSIER